MIGASTERKIIRKKAFDNKVFRIQVFHGKQGKSNNQSQHTQTTKEDRQVEHLIRTIRRNAKIQNGKENHKATHSSRYQKTETPPLPAKPPKTNKGADLHIPEANKYKENRYA